MLKYNIVKVTSQQGQQIIHTALPSIPDAKRILEDMELSMLGAGENVISYALAFAVTDRRQRIITEIYRIEGAHYA